jgi:TolB-like protein
MSGDADQDYFADGMVEEIITALSRIKWLFVIARNSSLQGQGGRYKAGRARAWCALRARRQRAQTGSRVRTTGQLIDTISGAHLWAEHFDAPLENIFEVLECVATSVAGVIEPASDLTEQERLDRLGRGA